jgi:hypothetical protein
MVKIIPVSRAYREGHEKIRWGKDDSVPALECEILPVVCETKVYPAVGWVLGECNYQGC